MKDDAARTVFRVLSTVATFEPGYRGGGPVISVARIIDSVSPDIEVSLITSDRDHGSTKKYPDLSGQWIARNGSRVFYLSTRSPRQWLRLIRNLRRQEFDLLYLNSLWNPVFSVAAVLGSWIRLVHSKQILLAPRGELSPGALSLKRRKKQLFLRVWRPLLQRLNVQWHASTEMEEIDILATFPHARVIVNADQINPPYEPEPSGLPHNGPVRLVFIGRISPKKNLVLTLEALSQISSPAEFHIFGPTEDRKYWNQCTVLIKHLPANVLASYRGELAPKSVRSTFNAYDAFVFPTLGENFGHVIAESLAGSCPVICSNETPWSSILRMGGGVVLDELSTTNLAQAIERFATMNPTERVAAKLSAGRAFTTWRENTRGRNLLDEVRQDLLQL